MGVCEDAPDKYCGHVLEPEDGPADGNWHKKMRNAVCLRAPKYDGLCVWHADTDEKDAEELVISMLTPADFEETGLEPAGGSWEPHHLRNHLSGAILRGVEFPAEQSFEMCVLIRARFEATDLFGATFSETYLRSVTFSETNLRSATFSRKTNLRWATFSQTDLLGATFSQTDLLGATFSQTDLFAATFSEASLFGATFSETNPQEVTFSETNLRRATFSKTNLQEATFFPACTTLIDVEDSQDDWFGASLEDAQFEDGTDLRGADLSGARLYQTAFRDVRINDETRFGIEDENPYGTACRYEYDPNTGVSINEDTSRFEAAAWTYRRLESLFEENAMSERARIAHIRKEEAQRAHHVEQLEDDEWVKENEVPPDSWLKSLGEYAVSTVNWHLHRHGESLRRLLGMSGLLILLCGIIYSGAGIARSSPETTYRLSVADLTNPGAVLVDLLNGLYFSVITFSTIGYGNFYPASPLSRFLVGIESLAGGLFIALFVFVIGRRVAR